MNTFGGRQVVAVAVALCVVATACSVKRSGTTKAGTKTGGDSNAEQARGGGGFAAPGGVKPGTQATKDGVVPPSSVSGNGGAAPDRGVTANEITLGAIILR